MPHQVINLLNGNVLFAPPLLIAETAPLTTATRLKAFLGNGFAVAALVECHCPAGMVAAIESHETLLFDSFIIVLVFDEASQIRTD